MTVLDREEARFFWRVMLSAGATAIAIGVLIAGVLP